MKKIILPLIVEPAALEKNLGQSDLLVVDMSKQDTYSKYHIPGAVHLEYSRIVDIHKPVMGLLPGDTEISNALSSVGIDSNTHVVAYDDEGGGNACRLLWTLDVMGHQNLSLLNGGLHAWANENHKLDNQPVQPTPSSYTLERTTQGIAEKEYILQHLEESNIRLLDTRTPEEFSGAKKYAERGGHVPNAINLDWIFAIDQNKNLRLKPDEELRKLLKERNITQDKEIIVYCQTHHRSSHTYIVLKHLGYKNLKGYHGAWSDWGNDPDVPVES